GVVAVVMLLFGASGAFLELHEDLNKMWDARSRRTGLMGMILRRAFAFVLVVASGVLLFASMLASTALSVVGKYFSSIVPVPLPILDLANFLISFGVLTLLFALIYGYVPDCRLPWRDLWIGAAVSALFFVIGKALLGVYLARAAVGSAY